MEIGDTADTELIFYWILQRQAATCKPFLSKEKCFWYWALFLAHHMQVWSQKSAAAFQGLLLQSCHATEEETEVWKGDITCSIMHSNSEAHQGFLIPSHSQFFSPQLLPLINTCLHCEKIQDTQIGTHLHYEFIYYVLQAYTSTKARGRDTITETVRNKNITCGNSNISSSFKGQLFFLYLKSAKAKINNT